MKKHIIVHPGELLREEFLTPLGITPYRLANDAKLPHQRVNEKSGIIPTGDNAVREVVDPVPDKRQSHSFPFFTPLFGETAL